MKNNVFKQFDLLMPNYSEKGYFLKMNKFWSLLLQETIKILKNLFKILLNHVKFQLLTSVFSVQ